MKKPIEKDGQLLCPECGEELSGDGENHLECINCDYVCHEADIK